MKYRNTSQEKKNVKKPRLNDINYSLVSVILLFNSHWLQFKQEYKSWRITDESASIRNKMDRMRFVAFIFLAVAQSQVLSDDILKPQLCGSPRPVVFPINHPDYMYWPYFTELHRCGGSCSMISPRIQRCGASSVEVVSRSVFDLASGEQKVIQLKNHTSCNCSCALDAGSCRELEKWDSDSCSCVCKIPVDEPFVCPTNYRWQQYLCKCICNVPPKDCPVNKVWSSDQCRCVCSVDALKLCAGRGELVDKETCYCRKLPPVIAKRDATGVPRSIMFVCMIAELVLLLILFDIFLYCKFKTGAVTAVWRKFCATKRRDVNVPLQNETGNPKHDLGHEEFPAS